MRIVLGIGIAFGLSACGSIKTRDVNAGELSTVRKVAIASFSFQQPAPSSVGMNLNTGRVEAGADRDVLSHEETEVTLTYTDIASTLNGKMKWQVVSLDELRRNGAYKEAYESKMKGWQNKMPPNNKLFGISEVMDSQSLRRMRLAEKDRLMAGLGVDAVIEMDVQVTFANTGVKFMGIGSRYPQAHVSFWLYKRGVEKPVWFEGQLSGDVSTESVGKTGFFDEKSVTHLGRLSAKSAFNKLNPKME